MANKELRLQCDLASSNVILGAGHKGTNKIVVRLTNTGDDIQFSGRGAQGTLSLAYAVGTQATDFVATDEEASAIQVAPAAGWQQNPYKNLVRQAIWSYRLPSLVLKAKEETSLTITGFECNTDPGKAVLTVKVAVTGYDNFEKSLDVEKKTADELQILYFRANPPQIITQKDRSEFVLEWNTIKADPVKLYKADQLLYTGTGEYQNGKKFTYRHQNLSLTFVYKLVAVDATDPDKRQERQITVEVVQRGWHRVDDFRNKFGYPSVFCNMDDLRLYGIFVNEGKAALCSSTHPVVVWKVETTEVPENMATSPSAYLGNRLWLIGGSAADTTNFSNGVWLYSPESGTWTKQTAPPWKPRMGHVCVVSKNHVWMFGGLDAEGKALKEVWSCSVEGDWKRHADALWPARCFHTATFFNGKFWVYGGFTQPFSDPLQDLWTSADGETWQSYAAVPKVDGKPGKPLGCALQELNGKLNLFGTFRKETNADAIRFILEEGQQTWLDSKVPIEQAWDQQELNTFSLSCTQYKGLAFLRSLNYEVVNNPTDLNVFVP